MLTSSKALGYETGGGKPYWVWVMHSYVAVDDTDNPLIFCNKTFHTNSSAWLKVAWVTAVKYDIHVDPDVSTLTVHSAISIKANPTKACVACVVNHYYSFFLPRAWKLLDKQGWREGPAASQPASQPPCLRNALDRWEKPPGNAEQKRWLLNLGTDHLVWPDSKMDLIERSNWEEPGNQARAPRTDSASSQFDSVNFFIKITRAKCVVGFVL